MIKEQEKIKIADPKDYNVLVDNLRKIYNNRKIAVKSLSFGIKTGEVFLIKFKFLNRFFILMIFNCLGFWFIGSERSRKDNHLQDANQRYLNFSRPGLY